VKEAFPSNSLRMRFAANLREERSKQGMSQEALALKISMSRNYLSGIETARTNASLDVVERIADGLNLPPWRLIFDREIMGEEPDSNQKDKTSRR
jgi:transcriptional regulator with XRE-family HTH domain